jgi:hypothetical protein
MAACAAWTAPAVLEQSPALRWVLVSAASLLTACGGGALLKDPFLYDDFVPYFLLQWEYPAVVAASVFLVTARAPMRRRRWTVLTDRFAACKLVLHRSNAVSTFNMEIGHPSGDGLRDWQGRSATKLRAHRVRQTTGRPSPSSALSIPLLHAADPRAGEYALIRSAGYGFAGCAGDRRHPPRLVGKSLGHRSHHSRSARADRRSAVSSRVS